MAENNLPNLADDTIPGIDLSPLTKAETLKEGGDALDALLKQVAPDEGTPADPPPVAPAVTPPAAVTPPPAVVPPAAPAAIIPPPAAPAVTTPPAATPPVEAKKEKFDDIELPPYTKPKSVEAFATVKQMARARISEVEKERDELQGKLKTAEEKATQAGKLPPEVEKELTDLRDFRARLDVEADPSFKEFDTTIAQNGESIISKLKEVGVGEDVIKKINEIGVTSVNWDQLLDRLSPPPTVRRFIEAKLVANEDLKEQKQRAVDEAKSHANEFLKERGQQIETGAKEFVEKTESHFKELIGQVSWYNRVAVPAGGKPEEKAAAEAHNKFIDTVDQAIKDSANDGSPEAKAILTLGYVQMLRLQREITAVCAGAEAEKKAWETEKTALEAQLKERDDFIAKIKKSSATSIRSAPAADPAVTARTPSTKESGSDALDRIRAEQSATA